MKQSKKLDVICISKILKYIRTINDSYTMFNIRNANDLDGNDICQLAITQAITNIYQLRQKIREESLTQMPLFNKIGLKAARNIASHDYDSLDFNIIYKRTLQLLRQEISDELEAVKNGIQQCNTGD